MNALLFDLDNTLYDRDESFIRWAQWFVRERLGLHEDSVRAATIDLLVRLDANGYGSREALFREIKQRHPSLAATVEDLVATFYQEHVSTLSLDSATQQLLDALQAADVPFGIVTNGSPNQLLKIRQLGLDKRTSCIFVSAIVGVKKPEPAIFLAAAKCLGIPPHGILFVGDNPEADIVGAANVGMRTAWLQRGQRWPAHLTPTPDFTMDSLNNLINHSWG